MKKTTAILITILILSSININNVSASDTGYFRVTAYYSPLPNQKYYIKWNYIAEKRMNWEWIRWASWRPVFSWMIAAPKKYSFWTKIYLDWLGIWEVTDRGWAIVSAWERNFKHDRIDVWVWYWDEGLRRAMYWGNRVIKWSIVKSYNKTSINYKKIPSPYWATSRLKANNYQKYNSKKSIKTEFELLLDKELKIFQKKVETIEEIKILEEKLSDLWLYNWEIDWNYKNIEKIISDYQIEKKLILNSSHPASWYFWPQTRKNLGIDYKNYLIKEEEKRKKFEQFDGEIEDIKKNSLKKATERVNNIWNVRLWNISPNVRELQKTLSELWYFSIKDTAIFWNKTKQAIISYQLENKVISDINESWAWVFWPKTKESIKNTIANKYLLVELEKNKELVNYYKNKDSDLAEIENLSNKNKI